MKKTNFLQSASGAYSSARLMFTIGLAWDILMTSIGLMSLKWPTGEAIAFFTAIAAVFVGLKLGQKPMESKEPKSEGNETV